MMMTHSVIFFGVLLFGFSFIQLRLWYHRRKISHLRLRISIAEVIAEVTEKLRKNYKLTERQEAFLSDVLDSYESKRIVRALLLLSLFESTEDDNQKKAEKLSELDVKESDDLFADMVAFVVLCVLHASTYNFFLGGIFRKIMFNDVLGSPKFKAAAERKDFVNRSDVHSAFGGMLKGDALKAA